MCDGFLRIADRLRRNQGERSTLAPARQIEGLALVNEGARNSGGLLVVIRAAIHKGAVIMRLAALGIAVALGTAAAVSANATPMVPNLNDETVSNIVQVSGGCGWGFHRGYRGFCVRNRAAYYAPRYYAPRYYAPRYHVPYYGGGYYRPHRYWYGY
jgi:hypothetical protein